MQPTADIGLIGLAVMGQNLVLNMNDSGYTVAVYNRTTSKVDRFLADEAAGTKVIGTHSLDELVGHLKSPRRVMMMVKAGRAVDIVIDQLLPHLAEGDIIIDGGNSNYRDSVRRTAYLEKKGLRFVGCGVSGGEEGARFGPSLMPGGDKSAWPAIKLIMQNIAAKATEDGRPCCEWLGANGAGHFVKMVHNGIEYGDMQMISEVYDLMGRLLGMSNKEMSAVFDKWYDGKLNSFLIEITRDILAYEDEDGVATIDVIMDTAGQKGTGKWTAVNALEQGIPLTLIGEAVFARFLSALKTERCAASQVLQQATPHFEGDKAAFIDDLREALYASKIVSYAQGYMLMRSMSEEKGWRLDFGAVAAVWRAGCIVRARFLNDIMAAYEADPNLTNLLVAPFFKDAVESADKAWRRVIATAVQNGIPVPAMSSALAFYDGYRRERVPANMIQAQRDYFGAHTYERIDRPRGEFFHTNWTGRGGDATSTSYNA
ncbi:MAG: decarboxylating NADP(+)-dependent phosphogluconate dehydrogenase [Candidatus Promineifilaceae bacterium]